MLEVQQNVSKGNRLMNQLIYVVEDESDIAELIKFNLAMAGHRVQCFSSGDLVWAALLMERPDLLLLDIMLPGQMNGLDICKKLKSQPDFNHLPIIIISAKGEESDVVTGLELGADDYLPKPFSPQILKARVAALLRRNKASVTPIKDKDVIEYQGLSVHVGRHEVKVNNQLVDLTHSEFKILHFLIQRPGWVFTRGQIVEAIRGDNYAVTDRSIDFQMVGLRKKLDEMGHFIETVRGVGYRFKE